MSLNVIYKKQLPEPSPVVEEFAREVINDGFTDGYETWRMFADIGGSGVYADLRPTEVKAALDDYAIRKELTNLQKSEICVWLNGLFLDREVYDGIDRYAEEHGLSDRETYHIRDWFKREMADSAISPLLTL